jgi:hypothetical protein
MRRRIVLLPALAGLSLLMAALAQPVSAAAGFAFNGPVKIPGSDGGNEPYIALASQATAVNPVGYRYATWQSPALFAGSADGQTFTPLATPDDLALGDTTDQVDAAGSLYNGQICGVGAVLHTCISRSDDGGASWAFETQAADMHPGASDRPWIDVYPKTSSGPWSADQTTVFLEYHTFSPDDLTYATISTDGGRTFTAPVPLTQNLPSAGSSFCSTIPSGTVADQKHPGTVYFLWLSSQNAVYSSTTGCNYSQIQIFNEAWVSTCHTTGLPAPALRCAARLAWRGNIDTLGHNGDNADKIFGTISQDLGGQLHILLPVRFDDDAFEFTTTGTEAPRTTGLVLATSPDQGAHWTPPFVVTSRFKGSNFFPWIAAGSKGKVDALFYRTSSRLPNSSSAIWYISFLQVSGAKAAVVGGAAQYVTTPSVSAVIHIDPGAVHVGGICSFGIFCTVVSGNRNLADSISITLDPAGGAEAIWTKDTNPGTASEVDFACQTAGPSAYAGMPALNGCYEPPGG